MKFKFTRRLLETIIREEAQKALEDEMEFPEYDDVDCDNFKEYGFESKKECCESDADHGSSCPENQKLTELIRQEMVGLMFESGLKKKIEKILPNSIKPKLVTSFLQMGHEALSSQRLSVQQLLSLANTIRDTAEGDNPVKANQQVSNLSKVKWDVNLGNISDLGGDSLYASLTADHDEFSRHGPAKTPKAYGVEFSAQW